MTDTLCELRVAIEGNNVQRVAEIQDSLRPLPLIREKYFNCDCMVVDELATLLIPSDFYIPDDSFYPVKTLGNGNCLFNSVSFFIKGNYTLSATLRTLTAAELLCIPPTEILSIDYKDSNNYLDGKNLHLSVRLNSVPTH